jgi:hypothetical protein
MAKVSLVTARRWQSGKLAAPPQVAAAIEVMVNATAQLSARRSLDA